MGSPSYKLPLDPAVAEAYRRFDDNCRELYQERAAIREHDAGLPRLQAERLALQDVLAWLDQRDWQP